MRPRISIWGSVCPRVSPSVRGSRVFVPDGIFRKSVFLLLRLMRWLIQSILFLLRFCDKWLLNWCKWLSKNNYTFEKVANNDWCNVQCNMAIIVSIYTNNFKWQAGLYHPFDTCIIPRPFAIGYFFHGIRINRRSSSEKEARPSSRTRKTSPRSRKGGAWMPPSILLALPSSLRQQRESAAQRQF